MDVLKILGNLLLAVFAIACCLVFLYWAFAILGAILAGLCYILPSLAALIGGVAIWRSGSDNLAVVWIIACLLLQFQWHKLVRGRINVDWAGNLADKLHHDLLTALRLKKYDPLKQCPRCGSRHFTAFKEKYKSYDTTDTETKTIRHYSSDGEEVGTTEIDYEVPTTSSVKIKLLKCDRCSKKWSIADGEVAYVPPD